MYRRLITTILCLVAYLYVPCYLYIAVAQTFNRYEESYNFKRAVEALQDKNDSEAIDYLNKEIPSIRTTAMHIFFSSIYVTRTSNMGMH